MAKMPWIVWGVLAMECCDGLGFEVSGVGDAGAGDAVMLDVGSDPLSGLGSAE